MENKAAATRTVCHNCLKPKAAHKKYRGDSRYYCEGVGSETYWATTVRV